MCFQQRFKDIAPKKRVIREYPNRGNMIFYLSRSHIVAKQSLNRDSSLWSLLLGHWYEIMALYYVKSILTEISASRQDRRVLQKSKIIRIEFLSKWGMLQTSRYV